MKRIIVTGNAGSGKSTFARQLSEAVGVPSDSLDSVVWQSGWKKTPKDERERRIHAMIERPFWIIDGVSYDVQERADTVVFLDVSRWVSFWRVAKRNWRFLFYSRPELPPKCPEILIIPTLIRIIWNFPTKIRPQILSRISSAQNFHHVRTQADRIAFFSLLKSREQQPSRQKKNSICLKSTIQNPSSGGHT